MRHAGKVGAVKGQVGALEDQALGHAEPSGTTAAACTPTVFGGAAPCASQSSIVERTGSAGGTVGAGRVGLTIDGLA